MLHLHETSCFNNAVVNMWLGVGTKNTLVRFQSGKDQVWAENTQLRGTIPAGESSNVTVKKRKKKRKIVPKKKQTLWLQWLSRSQPVVCSLAGISLRHHTNPLPMIKLAHVLRHFTNADVMRKNIRGFQKCTMATFSSDDWAAAFLWELASCGMRWYTVIWNMNLGLPLESGRFE